MQRRSSLIPYALVLLVTLVFLLALACSPKATPTPTPAPTATPTPTQPPPTATPTKAGPVATATPAPSGGITYSPVTATGKVKVAMTEVAPLCGDTSQCTYWADTGGRTSVWEPLFWEGEQGVMTPNVAESWKIVGTAPPDLKAVVTLKKGIKWNTPPSAAGKDFGELTAEDIVWSLNRINLGTNPKSTDTDAGDFKTIFGENPAVVVDKYTFEVPMVLSVFYGLPFSEWGILAANLNYLSKSAFDQMGADWLRDNRIGTGPYVISEWKGYDHATAIAVPNHWRVGGQKILQEFTQVQVPEPASQIAMIQSGEVDLALTDFTVEADAAKSDPKLKLLNVFKRPDGDTIYYNASMLMSGNLWEEKHARTGADLNPWLSPVYKEDVPWLGNPWCDLGKPCQYTDTNNPAGMSDMEQARLVRWALEYGIDRPTLNKVTGRGYFRPLFSEYVSPGFEGWQADRTVTEAQFKALVEDNNLTSIPEYAPKSAMPDQKWPYNVPYDPVFAGQLLDKAGFPKGADGWRFSMNINAYVCETGQSCLAVADVVGSQLRDIGIKTEVLKEDYSTIISPRMRNREQWFPVIKNGDIGSNNMPLDFPYPPADSSLTRPGWGSAFDSPFLAQMYLKDAKEPSRENRIKWSNQIRDYMMYQMLYVGVYQQPAVMLARADRIQSWDNPHGWIMAGAYYGGSHPELIKLVGW